MRHRVKIKHFNRDTQHRKALLTNLIRFLIENGEIVTTKEKAKEVKRLADKIIGKAKTDDLHTRRQLHKVFGKRDMVNTLVDTVAKNMADKDSGFTTTSNVGNRRGDNSNMVKLSLIKKNDKKGLKSPVAKTQKAKKETKKVETKKSAAVKSKKTATKKVASKKTASKTTKTKKESKS